jgi:hypothetical protein
MLAKVEAECGAAAAPGWKRFLTGLWLSGLRLREAIDLSWDGGRGIVVDMNRKRPMFVIAAESEKGNKDRILPMVLSSNDKPQPWAPSAELSTVPDGDESIMWAVNDHAFGIGAGTDAKEPPGGSQYDQVG